jgi:hypothetical protein
MAAQAANLFQEPTVKAAGLEETVELHQRVVLVEAAAQVVILELVVKEEPLALVALLATAVAAVVVQVVELQILEALVVVLALLAKEQTGV